MEIGIATDGMIVERMLRKKTKMISMTNPKAMASVCQTSLMAFSTKMLESKATHMSQLGGNVGRMASVSARMACATETVLPLACLTIPRNTQGLPPARAMVR